MNTLTSYLHRITQKHNPDGIDYEELVPHFLETKGIPDSLYQICLRGKGERSESIIGSLPKGFQSNIRSLTDKNPTWSYHLIGDKENREKIPTCKYNNILEIVTIPCP